MTRLRLAVLQCPLPGPRAENLDRVEQLVRRAAADGAQLVLPPELFASPYFPREERAEFFDWAEPLHESEVVQRFAALASELSVVIPISFFELDGPHYYNSVAVADADGRLLGCYRKAHIPDGPGYEEKFYFRPGPASPRAWRTRAGTVGVGICWDQWFPEAARLMALDDAQLLLYPTAIGSEPEEPDFDSAAPWLRAMQGHAVCNVVPVAASNRVGREGELTFYGSSFICDHRGELLVQLDRQETGHACADLDLARVRNDRASMGLFRDRRPEVYGPLVSERQGRGT